MAKFPRLHHGQLTSERVEYGFGVREAQEIRELRREVNTLTKIMRSQHRTLLLIHQRIDAETSTQRTADALLVGDIWETSVAILNILRNWQIPRHGKAALREFDKFVGGRLKAHMLHFGAAERVKRRRPKK